MNYAIARNRTLSIKNRISKYYIDILAILITIATINNNIRQNILYPNMLSKISYRYVFENNITNRIAGRPGSHDLRATFRCALSNLTSQYELIRTLISIKQSSKLSQHLQHPFKSDVSSTHAQPTPLARTCACRIILNENRVRLNLNSVFELIRLGL